MKLADSHIHLFQRGFPGRYGALFPSGSEATVYETIRRAHRIDAALVVGYEGDRWAQGNNRYLAALAKTNAWMTPLAFCHPGTPPTVRQLAAWRSAGFSGLSLYAEKAADAEGLTRWPTHVLASLNERKAILSVNCPALLLGALAPFFERLENTRILISHLGSPSRLSPASKVWKPILKLAKHPQIGIKLSGAYACGEYPHAGLSQAVNLLLQSFGAGRLYWGSDFSPALDHISFPQTLSAFDGLGLPPQVFHDNLCRVIRRARTFRSLP